MVEGGIAMSGGYRDALLREGLGDGCSRVLLGGEGKELHQSGSGIKDGLGVVHGSRANVFRLMGTNEAKRRIEKRTLYVETSDDLASQIVLFSQTNHVRQLGRQVFNAVRNEGGEDAIHAIAGKQKEKHFEK